MELVSKHFDKIDGATISKPYMNSIMDKHKYLAGSPPAAQIYLPISHH